MSDSEIATPLDSGSHCDTSVENVQEVNSEAENRNSMSRVQSAATEPIGRTSSRITSSIRSQKFKRTKTAPVLGRCDSVAIPINLLEKRPSVKTEASVFYTFLNYCDVLKDQLVDKTFQRTDKIYGWFWNLRPVKSFITNYEKWEQTFIIGFILQVLRCFLNTRSVFLLPFFPVGIVFYKRENDILAVVFLFLSLMYFAKVLSNCTEWASEHFGPVIGSLLNATFGNLVELIISGTTVSKDDATLTITSLVGSVISNNLFVTGSCSFFGGLEGAPLVSKKSITSNIVFFVAVTLLMCLMTGIDKFGNYNPSLEFKMNLSQVAASLIFLNYLVYIVSNTHEEFKNLKVRKEKNDIESAESYPGDLVDNSDIGDKQEEEEEEEGEGEGAGADTGEEEEFLPPKMVCFGALALSIAGLGPCANFFVEALKDLTDDKPISKVFIGLIILPLAGSLPEHLSAVTGAYKGKMDLAMNLSIGSSNQVIGFVLPIIQFISSKYPSTGFTFFFNTYISIYLFVTAFVSSICLINGLLYGINIFHGTLLISTFVFITFLTFMTASQ